MQHGDGSLVAAAITKSHGAEIILDGVSLTVEPRARIGIVGSNGSGKTTLLRILAGLEPPDSGRVARTPATLGVRYLPQEPDARAGERLADFLALKTGMEEADERLEALVARLAAEPTLADAYTEALDRFLALGGDDFPARARQAANAVGLGADRLEQPLRTMSGGEAARASLAAILLTRVDVLLLDEPTNNLDFAGLEQLETFVATTPASVVVVSHDRAFLERTVTRVLEFEGETRAVREFAGSWGDYERARAAARRRHEEAYGHYVAERDRFEHLLRARQNQARAAGGMADQRGTHALSSKVRAADKRLERLEVVDKPWQPWRLRLELAPARRGGDVVARLERAVLRRGTFQLGPVDFELRSGDRLAVVGANGSGKTTFVSALAGESPPAAGNAVLGSGIRFGRLDQERAGFAPEETLLRAFGGASGLRTTEARTLLAKFALGDEDVTRRVRSLTPGERARAVLALLAAEGANALALDEPTNHLDLEAIEELETALEDYPGTIVLVTHDRRLLERFRPTRVVEVEHGRVRERRP